MVQEIIAYLIISTAFGIFILNTLRFFNVIGKKSSRSSKCGACSSGCEVKELHQFSKPKFAKHDLYKFYL